MSMEIPIGTNTPQTPENLGINKIVEEFVRRFGTELPFDNRPQLSKIIAQAITKLELENKRWVDIVKERYQLGKSRKEVGEIYGNVIPERIRQIEVKVFTKIVWFVKKELSL